MAGQKWLLVLFLVSLVVAISSKQLAAEFPNQSPNSVLYIGLVPQPQSPLIQYFAPNRWFANFDVNIAVTFTNKGNQLLPNGTIRLAVSVPSKTWIALTDYSVPLLGLGQSYPSFLLFTPREDGLYTVNVDSSNTKIAATIQGGFLPINIEPSSAYSSLTTNFLTIGVSAIGVIATIIGVIVASRGALRGRRGRR